MYFAKGWGFGSFVSYWGNPWYGFNFYCGGRKPWHDPIDNTAPIANDDYVRMSGKFKRIDILANDTDEDGDGLKIATINGEKVRPFKKIKLYDDEGNKVGWAKVTKSGELIVKKRPNVDEITLTYTVKDRFDKSEQATVTIVDEDATFRLNLLHFTDQEAGARAVEDAPNLSAVLNALRDEDVDANGTLTLSAGDAFIPGLFFDASEAVYGAGGVADILIQNELGVQAVALGNHEFDLGTGVLAGLISGSATAEFGGTLFPYLSANLNFSTDANLQGLAVEGGQAPQGGVVSSSTVIETGGEKIGVVGATTPTLASISSPDGVGISPVWAGSTPTDGELDALARVIQAEVNALLDANTDMNKIVLLSHMQQLSIEEALAERLVDVDIIVAGGSNTRLFDDNDRPRDGDSDQGQYPLFIENAGGTTTAVVNTDGSYKYVGRLVVDFDADGNIIPASYDEDVSGAFATDDQGVVDLNAGNLVDAEVQEIADSILAQIVATEGNVFGVSNVYLNGNRSGLDTADDPDGVRTQETNLGNLTADANLEYANSVFGDGDDIWLSLKNGGGIRASIGDTVVLPGDTEPTRVVNEAVFDADGNEVKPTGGISQNDIQTVLAFNNDLVVGQLSGSEIVALLEHGMGALPDVSGRFSQISGLEFSFDPDAAEGARIDDAAFVDENGDIRAVLVNDGTIVNGDTDYNIVTLGFLAGGGDGYPFPADFDFTSLEIEGTQTGGATFADDGTEQDALAEYLLNNHATAETAYNEADVGRDSDSRIINLSYQDGAALDLAVDQFLLA